MTTGKRTQQRKEEPVANTIGFQLYTLMGFEDGVDAAFEAVKGMGIDTIEAWCGAVPETPGEGMSMDDLRKSLTGAGMKLSCGHLGVADFDSRYEPWRDLLLDFGSKDWVIPFADGKTLEGWLAMLPKFKEMAARLKEDGLSLGYHNHSLELVKMGDKYVFEHLLDGMPELNAQFHLGQFKPERGIDVSDWLRKYQGRVCSLHVNDSDADGATRLGEGACKAQEAIRTAVDTGVETFILEVMLTRESLDGVKRDVELTRSLIE